jgi:hypothetical protein
MSNKRHRHRFVEAPLLRQLGFGLQTLLAPTLQRSIPASDGHGVTSKTMNMFEHVWNLYGICMEYLWNMSMESLYGICMESLWNLYGISMEYVYGISIWNMNGISMESLWKNYAI